MLPEKVDVLDIEYTSNGKWLLVGVLVNAGTHHEEYFYEVNPQPQKIRATYGHYKISDESYLNQRGWDCQIEWDTQLMTVVDEPDLTNYGLKALSGMGYPDLGGQIDKFVWAGFLKPLLEYNQKDCQATWKLAQERGRVLQFDSFRRALIHLQGVQELLWDMQHRGVRVEGSEYYRQKYQEIYQEKLRELKEQWGLKEKVLRSPAQLLRFLNQWDSGLTSTAEEPVMLSWEIPEGLKNLIREAKSAARVETLVPEDGILFPEYRMHRVLNGRITCENPNIQQVPKDVRACFVPTTPGNVFMELDYSTAELFAASFVANRVGWRNAVILPKYREGHDLHTFMANLMGGTGTRHSAKAVNFGFLYGMGPQRFVNYAKKDFGVTFSLEEAQSFRDLYFRTYPELQYLHRVVCSQTVAPTGRGLPKDKKLTTVMPAVVAGFSSDSLLSATKVIWRKGFQPVLTVHDSVLFEVSPEQVSELKSFGEIISRPPVPMPPGWEWGRDGFRYEWSTKNNWKGD